jgi:hypothetical protein
VAFGSETNGNFFFGYMFFVYICQSTVFSSIPIGGSKLHLSSRTTMTINLYLESLLDDDQGMFKWQYVVAIAQSPR